MEKSKVIDIFRTFSPDELKRFRDFVHSPFHNKNKNVIRLFEILKKYYPDFESIRIAKEKIFVKLFPGKKYNDVVIRILISDLLKLSEEYLSYYGFQKKSIVELKCLLNELKERNLDSLYKSNLKIAESLLSDRGKIDLFHFYEKFELETFAIDQLISRDKQSLTAEKVLKQGEYLLCFFMTGILNVAHELLTFKDVLNVTFDFNLAEEAVKRFDIEGIINYMKKNNYKYSPIISIYYNMYKSYIHPDKDEYYIELKNLVEANFELFNHDEKVNLLIILENVCLTRVAAGNENFYRDLMDIYKSMLLHKLYYHSKKENFQLNLFRNMFYTSVILKDYEWAADFLKKYINELSAEQQEDMINYSQAILNFEKRNFDKALEEITKVNHKFFVYKFDVKLIMLKIYYEQGSYESGISLIDSFSHFLSKNKSVSAIDKERFGKFLKFLNSLIKIKTGSVSMKDINLKKQISDTVGITSKKWLLKKFEELEGT